MQPGPVTAPIFAGNIAPSPRWQHQQEAFDYAIRKWTTGWPGVLLAYGMGTGKTRIAIDLIEGIHGSNILVVCPLRVIAVWEKQLELHARFPYRLAALDERAGTTLKKAATAKAAMALARAEKIPCIILVNYESLLGEALGQLALNTAWSLVVCDEAHRIKQASGKISRLLGRVSQRALRRLALTGTPLPHSLLDAWAIFRFLDPRIYDRTYHEFKMRYAVWGGFEQRVPVAWKNEEDFKSRFYSIALRVTTDDVLDLPPEMDQTLYCRLAPGAQKQYEQMEQDFITWVGEAGEEATAANAMVALLRLQQMTGGVLKDDNGTEHPVDSAKERLVADWLEDLEPGEPVVLFARFVADLDALARACVKTGKRYSEVSGRSKHGIAPWQAGETDILLAQIHTASEGQDLTRARYAGYYSTGFYLNDYVQSRARIRRPGQTRPVTYYHFLVRDSIDEIVLRALRQRRNVIETILTEVKQNDQRLSIPAVRHAR